jgi:hypothetical protein
MRFVLTGTPTSMKMAPSRVIPRTPTPRQAILGQATTSQQRKLAHIPQPSDLSLKDEFLEHSRSGGLPTMDGRVLSIAATVRAGDRRLLFSDRLELSEDRRILFTDRRSLSFHRRLLSFHRRELFFHRGELFFHRIALFFHSRELFFDRRQVSFDRRLLFVNRRELSFHRRELSFDRRILFPDPRWVLRAESWCWMIRKERKREAAGQFVASKNRLRHKDRF